MLRIRTLGALEIHDPSGSADVDAVLAQPKRAALLLYLALHRGGLRSRDDLMTVFWPESPADRAANALNQSLHFLRAHLGREVILTRGGGVEVSRDRVTCDVLRFERLLGEGRLAEALELYGGELLAGFHLSGARQFESWLEGERRRLADSAVEAALELGRSAEEAGRPAAAAHRYREALRWQPYREAVLRELVRALLAAGERPAALREARRFAQRLEADLGMAASDGLRALLDTLQEGAVSSTDTDRPAPAQLSAAGEDADARPEGESSGKREVPGSGEPVSRRLPDWIRHPATIALALVAAVAAAVGAMQLTGERSGDRSLDPGRILVSPLQAVDGDPERSRLGRLAAEWAAREIGATGLVEVVSPQTVVGWSGTAEGRENGSLASGLLEAARGVGAGYVLDGFVSAEDGNLRLSARIVRVASGAISRTVPAVEFPSDSSMGGIQEFGRRVVGSVAGLTDARVGSWATAAGPPPSFEAYRHFVDGLDAFAERDNAAALRRFESAASEDSLFALPLLWQMIVYQQVLDDVMKADSLVRLVGPYRERLTVWEAAMLDYHAAAVRGDRGGAYRAMERVVAITPDPQWVAVLASEALRLNRAAAALDHLGRIPREVEHGSDGWPLMDDRWIRSMTADALHRAGRFMDELRVARGDGTSASRTLRRPELRALAGLERWEDVLKRVSALSPVADNSPGTRWMLREAVLELRAHGAPAGVSGQVLERLLDLHRADPASDPIGYGRALVLAGRYDQAIQVFEEVRSEGGYADVVRGDLALLAALRGDTLAARAAGRAYAVGTNPHDLGWNTQWRARIAAALGERDRAVALLKDAYSQGWSHILEDHRSPHWQPLRGFPPFERLMAPDLGTNATAGRLSLDGG